MGKLVEEQDAPRVRHTLLEEGIVDVVPQTASADLDLRPTVCYIYMCP